MMSEEEPDDDLHFYNISSQDWQRMIITSPNGNVRYYTESDRSFLSGKSTTVISKIDAGRAATTLSAAKRVIARLDFLSTSRKAKGKDKIVYGLEENDLDDLFPVMKWPEGWVG